jgi:hypothetical protein
MHPEELLCKLWFCQRCGFRSPWWKGSGRFPLCTACERLERSHRVEDVAPHSVTPSPQPTQRYPARANLSAAVYSYRPQRR